MVGLAAFKGQARPCRRALGVALPAPRAASAMTCRSISGPAPEPGSRFRKTLHFRRTGTVAAPFAAITDQSDGRIASCASSARGARHPGQAGADRPASHRLPAGRSGAHLGGAYRRENLAGRGRRLCTRLFPQLCRHIASGFARSSCEFENDARLQAGGLRATALTKIFPEDFYAEIPGLFSNFPASTGPALWLRCPPICSRTAAISARRSSLTMWRPASFLRRIAFDLDDSASIEALHAGFSEIAEPFQINLSVTDQYAAPGDVAGLQIRPLPGRSAVSLADRRTRR